MSNEENLSKEFVEILQNSNLSEEAKEAIRIISKGGTPSGNQVKRPDLMNIIKFLLQSYDCLMMISEIDKASDTAEAEVEKPFNCPKCDKRFVSKEDGCKHAETIIDLGMECFNQKTYPEETISSCSRCDKKFSNAEDLKTHEMTHAEICPKYRMGSCIFGSRGKNKEGQCPKEHPRKCAKFLNDIKGCTTKDCIYLHPTICKFVKNGRPCLVAGCTLAHPVTKSKPGASKETPTGAKIVTNGSDRPVGNGPRRTPPPAAKDGNGNIQPPKGGNRTPKTPGSFLGQEVILKMMDTMTNLTNSIQSVTDRISALELQRQEQGPRFNQRSSNSSWWRN